jgi:hypothetical protein
MTVLLPSAVENDHSVCHLFFFRLFFTYSINRLSLKLKTEFFFILDKIFSLDFSLESDKEPDQRVVNMHESLVSLLIPAIIEVGQEFETIQDDSIFSICYLNSMSYIFSITPIEKIVESKLLTYILDVLVKKVNSQEMSARVRSLKHHRICWSAKFNGSSN